MTGGVSTQQLCRMAMDKDNFRTEMDRQRQTRMQYTEEEDEKEEKDEEEEEDEEGEKDEKEEEDEKDEEEQEELLYV